MDDRLSLTRRTLVSLGPSSALCSGLPRWPGVDGPDAPLAHLYRDYYRLCEHHGDAVALVDTARIAGVRAPRRQALEAEERQAWAAVEDVRSRFWATPTQDLPGLVLKFRLLFRTEWYDGRWPETGVLHSGPIDSVNKTEAEAALMDLERLAARHGSG